MSDPRVFLSAVTADFGLEYLDQLRICIHDLGCVCRYRGNLVQGGKLLPKNLRDEIESVDCVIHLVGPRFGFGPKDIEMAELECTPAGQFWKPACKAWWPFSNQPARRSYTQMEYDFATESKRPVFVFFIDDPALIAAAAVQPKDEADLQSEHRRAIEAYGHARLRVQSIAALADIAAKLPIIVQHLRKQIGELQKDITTATEAVALLKKDLRRDLQVLIERQKFTANPKRGGVPIPNRRIGNRERMIERVHAYWVEGVLHQAIKEANRFNVGYQLAPEAVLNHVDYSDCRLSADTDFGKVFNLLGAEVLILGTPGSGKTIILLQLAEQLLAEARAYESKSIPIELNLSSWSHRRETLDEWIVNESAMSYQVPRRTIRRWVDEEAVTPLLDGLDEVLPGCRDACVEAINQFHRRYRGAGLGVCSRLGDYELLHSKLELRAALLLQPLDDGGDHLVCVSVLIFDTAFPDPNRRNRFDFLYRVVDRFFPPTV